MSEKITAWLNRLQLGQYAAGFEENAIEFDILPDLTDDDLREIGVNALGHRKTILKAINALNPDQADDLPQADTTSSIPDSSHSAVAEDTTAWSRTPGERKPVTMLFADIVGSTGLTEKLDAEDAHDLLYQATQYMCQAVENNQGTVCRFMGDGIMAMFGAPIASERHALEACRAALDMQTSIAKYASQIEASHGMVLQARVGLHSGEVVVLEVGDDPQKPEYDASGPTVPLAARMEQSATAGTIQMTRETRALAGDSIETIEHPAVMVKGVSEPVVAYQLQKVLSASETATIATRHPIVGRKSELGQFASLLEECLASGHGQTVFVRGEAGIGKTRLVDEMTDLASKRGFTSHKALVLDFGAGKGQGAIPSLVRSLLGITQGSGKRARELALDRAENDGVVEHDNRVFLNDLLDLRQAPELRALYDAMDAQARKEGKQAALVSMLTRLAVSKPVFVVVEDLHWADSITLVYLARLTAAVVDSRSLMVFTSRAEGDPLDTTWRASAGETPIVTWDLSPLRKEESIMLVSSFIDAGDSLAKRCIERAAGNPLFLEQLLLNVEKGVSENVPDSIKSLVLSRMDHLSREDKQALQAAAVLGQRFELQALRFLIDAPGYECKELVEHRLVRPEGPLFLFAHALIREGAAASLLKRQRTGLHRQAAEWYSERDTVLYAEHLDHAGEAAAAAAYLDAAIEQSGLYRTECALQLTRRGLEVAADKERYALFCLEGELLQYIGSVPESINAYRQACNIAGEEVERCRALIGVAEGLSLIEAHDELLDVLDEAEKIAKARSLTLELAHVYQIRGGVLFFGSDTEACFDANTASLQYAREAGAPDVEARALSGLGDIEFSRGNYRSAASYFTQCIQLAREHGYGRVIAANLPMRAEIYVWENKFESAETELNEAVELAVKTCNLRAEMMALSCRGYLRAEAGDFAGGEKWLQRSLDITRLLGSKLMEGMCLAFLGNAVRHRGDRAKACEHAQQAIDILEQTESGMAFYGPIALGVLARATEDIDLRGVALARGEDILSGYSVAHNYVGFYEHAMMACLQTTDWDGVDRYAKALEDYTRQEPMPRCDYLIAHGRALAAHGRGKRDAAMITELKRLRDEAGRIGLKSTVQVLETALASP
jgi:class 3 adenylate cyclase/tetratricopeptide (TPR) repeat protein